MEGNSTCKSPWQTWGQHLAVTAAYAAAYQIVRNLTTAQWLLMADLRLACLLFMPMRLWPALAFGEWFGILPSVIDCSSTLGSTWAISAMLPHILVCMPFIKAVRQRWMLYDRDQQINMPMLIATAIGGSLITAGISSLSVYVAIVTHPGRWPGLAQSHYFWNYVVYAYVGTLVLVPAALALRDRIRQNDFASPWKSALFRDTLLWLPCLASLGILAAHTPEGAALTAVRITMISPVVTLAWRHGWHGAALGGFVAGLAMFTTTPDSPTPTMLQAQIALAAVMSCLLAYGGRPLRQLSAAPAGQLL